MKLKLLILFFIVFCCGYSQQSKKWYDYPLRISALQCNYENDTYAVIDKWADMGFNVEQLFHPIADNYSAIYDEAKHHDILKKYIAEAHLKGIRIILYLNVHILGPSLDNKKEEWSQKNENGEVIKLYGTYPSICLNSSWKDYFFKVLDNLKELDIDGIFLDGPVIVKPGCFCENCRKKFRQMFGSEFGADSSLMWKFNAWTRDNFLQSAYDYWKKSNPEKIFYMNLPVLHSTRGFVNIENAIKYNDIIGTEGGFMFYKPAKEAFLFRTSFTAKLLEAMAPDKPRVIFMAADNKPWNWLMNTPAETELCISASIANASNIWYGLHGSTELLKTESAKTAKDILLFAKKNDKYFQESKQDSKVALLFSFINSLISNDAKDESDFSSIGVKESLYGDTEDALRGWYSMLTESQIPFDIISDLNLYDLKKYNVIICPNNVAIGAKTGEMLKEFVNNGGRLISESAFSLFDDTGKIKSDFGLRNLLGVSYSGGFKKHQPFNYFILDSNIVNSEKKYYPLPLLTWNINLTDGAILISRALEDLSGRYVSLTAPKDPFIVYNRYERGDSYYFAGNIGEMYNKYHIPEYKNIIGKIIDEKLPDKICFDNIPTTLEVISRKVNDETIIHLINYDGGPLRPMEKIQPVNNIKIKLPMSLSGKKIISLKTGNNLDRIDDYFILPVLNTYDILVIK
jgi:hypothetical protein